MNCLLLTIIGTIRITVSRPSIAGNVLGGLPEAGRSGSLARNQFRQDLPHTAGGSVSILKDENARLPYFWETKDFHSYKGQEFWKSRKGASSQRMELGSQQQVKAFKNDCLLLGRKMKEKRTGFTSIKSTTRDKSSFDILVSILKDIKNIFHALFPKQEHYNNYVVGPDLKWTVMGKIVREYISEFEDLLVNFQIIQMDPEQIYLHDLEVQVFEMVTLICKYKLVEEDYIEEWINKEPVLSSLKRHIHGMWSSKNLMGLELQESLSKSITSQHLWHIFTLIHNDSWKDIEYELLTFRIKTFNLPTFAAPRRFLSIINDFQKNNFHTRIITATVDQKYVSRNLVEYFGLPQITPVDSGDKLALYKLMMEIFNFLMNYHKTVFTNSFSEPSSAHDFSEKFQALNHLIKCFKTSFEIGFLINHGLWTTEIDGRISKDLINFEEAHNLSWISETPHKYLDKEFGLYFEKDIKAWEKTIIQSSQQMDIEKKNLVSDVYHYICKWSDLEEKYFGTNFLMKSPKCGTQLLNNRESHPKRISNLFLHTTYKWLGNLKFLLKEYEKNQKTYIQKIIQSSPGNSHSIKTSLRNWQNASGIFLALHLEIAHSFRNSQETWMKWKGFFRILNNRMANNNHNLDKSKEHSSTHSDLHKTQESIVIPKLNFHQKILQERI